MDDGRLPYWNFTSSFDFDLQCMYNYPHVMLNPPAKICRNRTNIGELLTSYRFFKMAVAESEIYFWVQVYLRDCIRSKWWKSVCIANWEEISQSIVEIKLLPVWENGRSPYWNSISCFNFDLSVVIGMWFCISMPHFVWRSPEELWVFWRNIDFQDGGHRVRKLLPCSVLVIAFV